MNAQIFVHDIEHIAIHRKTNLVLEMICANGTILTIFVSEANLTRLLDSLNSHKTRNADKIVGDVAILDEGNIYAVGGIVR